MRIHSRGHTNRTWVCLSSSEPLTAGSLVFSDGVQIGLVHRTTAGPLATATLKNDYAADGIQVTVDGVVATVKNWPL